MIKIICLFIISFELAAANFQYIASVIYYKNDQLERDRRVVNFGDLNHCTINPLRCSELFYLDQNLAFRLSMTKVNDQDFGVGIQTIINGKVVFQSGATYTRGQIELSGASVASYYIDPVLGYIAPGIQIRNLDP